MDPTETASLVRLGDTDLDVANAEEDVRGRTVLDRNGDEVGDVKSLLIDDRETKVRLLEVSSGGFLGLGGETRLVPVDAVIDVTEESVYIDQAREHVHDAPRYDPELTRHEGYYADVYGHYGYAPYWAPGYVYPGYPHYR